MCIRDRQVTDASLFSTWMHSSACLQQGSQSKEEADWRDGLGALEKGPLECGLSNPIMGFQSPSWAFFSRKMAPIFLEALNLWVRCRRRFFFLRKMAPIFLEALNLWVRCRRRLFFFRKMAPIFLEAPHKKIISCGASRVHQA